jgi:hypothetical protein
MKAFLWTTGIVFGLITVAHVWRVVAESRALAKDPWFLLISVVAAGLSIWAFRLLRTTTRS